MANSFHRAGWLFLAVFLLFAQSARAQDKVSLRGHVPSVVAKLRAVGRLEETNQLNLAIGVKMRDPDGLERFAADVSDPASPNFRHFLSPEEITARFGPSEADYKAVEAFAISNGFQITARHDNRLVLSVVAPPSAVEKAFNVSLRTYQHPTESRLFFAPDTEPQVSSDLPVADVQGLSDYAKPHSNLRKMDDLKVAPHSGSGSSGAYLGDDFRKAYASDTTLTGAGQSVGLLQFDGYYASDIAAYASLAGGSRSSIQIVPVLIDNYNGVPNSGSDEVSLDIEMAMAMAPGLSKIIVFEGNPYSSHPNDVLNRMAASNTVKNLSCSWGWGGGPSTTTENIFKTMAAQGQSFFNASGDSDAFVAGSSNDVDNNNQARYPSSSPNITQVGGTTLTTDSSAHYSSETVWNDGVVNNSGGYWGSCGGITKSYVIPSWQTNVSDMAKRGGSAAYRNIPDVALTAKNVYVKYGSGSSGRFEGTSCAAPLWAGFMALVNQQAVNNTGSPVGFINPAIYATAAGANYSSCFHDITTGNNQWPSSSTNFYATNGYDLCTGLGAPAGQALINALASGGSSADSPFYYTISSSAITITGYHGTSNNIVIPSSIDGYTVVQIGASAFNGATNAASVTIPNSVTNISDHAFYSCAGLTNVEIGSGVTSIGSYAFGYCSSLTSVTIPDSVTTVGSIAFFSCSGLTNVMIGGGVTNIGSYTFGLCVNLTSVRIPDSVTSVDDGAFYSCSSLANVTIPASVTTIGSYAFNSCSSLQSAYFQGDAPASFDASFFDGAASGFTIYYPSSAAGWSTPTWNGYPAQPYIVSPVISTGPASQIVTVGSNVTFTVAATGVSPFAYQWMRNGTNLSDSGRISGSTTASLVITGVQTNDAGAYSVAVSNSGGTTNSAAAALIVRLPVKPVFSTPILTASNAILINFTGEPGSNYVIYGSSDLKTWETIATVCATNGSGSVSIPMTSTQRFFRALLTP